MRVYTLGTQSKAVKSTKGGQAHRQRCYVLVPKRWLGADVKVVRLSKPDEQDDE